MPTLAEYTAVGWQCCLIEPGAKGPCYAKWNVEPLQANHVVPFGYGVGLLHTLSGTAALDIDDYAAAKTWLAERGIDIQTLLDASEAVQIVSGRPGSNKLLYALPAWLAMPSKKVVVGGRTILEMRCATADNKSVQDILPISGYLHVTANTEYEWRGDWRNLPPLPEALLVLWQQLLLANEVRRLPDVGTTATANWNEAMSALQAINPDCDRKSWVEVGMALHHAGELLGNQDEAFSAWDIWSAGSPKYKQREMAGQWRSFKHRTDGITTATLFHHARLAGWVRPVFIPDNMFGNVEKEPIETVKQRVSPGGRIPVIDLSLWPAVLANRAVEVGTEVGCDPVVPLMAGLAAVSGAADARTKLEVTNSWKVPPTWWAMTVGEPADKKTPGSKPMFLPLRKLEFEDKPRYQTELLLWQGKEARYATAFKAYREHAGDPSNPENSQPPEVPTLPPPPQPLRLMLNDATTQKVVTLAEFRPGGFLLWLDEMANWFSKLGNSRHTDDRGCWIQGYETGSYTMDRMGSGSISVENLSLSVYGNCQPEVFRKYAQDAAMDGLLQRFVPIALDPSRNAMWQDSRPVFLSHADEYEQMIRRTHALPVFQYVLTPEANELFRAFGQWALDIKDNERTLRVPSAYMTALGKIEGTCARLLLLFHLIESPHSPWVDAEVARRAITVVKTFIYPMMRYVFMVIGQERDMVGQVVVDYLIQCSTARPNISMADLRGACSGITKIDKYEPRNDYTLRAIMDEMIQNGWAVCTEDHPRQPKYAVNPELATVYAEQRQRVIAAKRAVIDAWKQDQIDNVGYTNCPVQKVIGEE